MAPTHTRIAIIGAGFGGIGLGIKLKSAGLDDFIILEKSHSVGGVWRENHYPGAACDVPSHLYSFSFEPRADWPDKYANRRDILDYLGHCTIKYGLEPHLRFGEEITEARWNEAANLWTVRSGSGRIFCAQSLIAATGQLSRPFIPQLPGLVRFAGTVFHSAQWRDDFDFRDRRIAVVGTGASAIQFVPAIAALVKRLYLFQRSAAYVLPKPDKAYPRWQRLLFGALPTLLRLNRLLLYLTHELAAFAFVTWPAALGVKRWAFRRHLRRGVANEEVRRRLTPDYRFGCKRILLSNDFYPAMDRPNVELITEGIREIRADSIVAGDGSERKVDCIIFGTGFTATEFLAPMTIIGRGGADLRQCWQSGAYAHLGMTVAGFPNFFMIYGPNTNLAHNSIVVMIESQIAFITACLERLARNEIGWMEVKKEVQDRFNSRIRRRLQKAVWAKGCTSWYLTAEGKNTNNWPGYSLEFMFKTRAPKWEDYAVR